MEISSIKQKGFTRIKEIQNITNLNYDNKDTAWILGFPIFFPPLIGPLHSLDGSHLPWLCSMALIGVTSRQPSCGG